MSICIYIYIDIFKKYVYIHILFRFMYVLIYIYIFSKIFIFIVNIDTDWLEYIPSFQIEMLTNPCPRIHDVRPALLSLQTWNHGTWKVFWVDNLVFFCCTVAVFFGTACPDLGRSNTTNVVCVARLVTTWPPVLHLALLLFAGCCVKREFERRQKANRKVERKFGLYANQNLVRRKKKPQMTTPEGREDRRKRPKSKQIAER